MAGEGQQTSTNPSQARHHIIVNDRKPMGLFECQLHKVVYHWHKTMGKCCQQPLISFSLMAECPGGVCEATQSSKKPYMEMWKVRGLSCRLEKMGMTDLIPSFSRKACIEMGT
ncbi:hypothetical protein KSX_04570 [Ktedonospora formicarum]|uniref:Uncharacterized protein n=1 Tax=Ktedonospora formicarum TaxID=2778364 RepID=A0A8J3HZU2_9CHLR|nr:hypothetical protein KSX_04570 [Ktedonospora formicarum]